MDEQKKEIYLEHLEVISRMNEGLQRCKELAGNRKATEIEQILTNSLVESMAISMKYAELLETS